MSALAAWLARLLFALGLTLATLQVDYHTTETALYGDWDPTLSNWARREVSGWPAPFLADQPGITMVHTVGIEDVFAPWPFLASLAFWLWVVTMLDAAVRRLLRRR